MSTTKPLAAIVRSSDGVKQRQQNGTYHADEDQLADIRRYVAGLHGKPDIAFMAPELDVSGGLPIAERPALREAIEGVEAGRYSGIVVAYLSRLTRSRSGIEIWDRVEAVGGHVHCAAESLDTSTPNGRFVRDIHLANAVREREEHVERFARRRAATVDAGIWRQPQIPRGYRFAGPPDENGRYTGKTRRLVVDPRGADEVRDAARQVLAGVPVVRIAEQLKMTPAGVRGLLRNRVYLGELRDGEYVNPAAHEAILDIATHDAVVQALNTATRPSRRVARGPALLAGIVRCSGCGKVMTRRSTTQVVYGCPVYRSGGRCPAPASITANLIDEHIEAIATDRYAQALADGPRVDDVAAAEARVDGLEVGLARVVRALATAGIDEDEAAADLRDLRDDLANARRALEAARARSASPIVLPGDEAYQRLDAAGRNIALRGLIDRIVVTRSGRGGRPDIAGRVEVVFRTD